MSRPTFVDEWGIFIRDDGAPVVYDFTVLPQYPRDLLVPYGIVFSVNSHHYLCTNCWDKTLHIGDDY